MKNRKAWALVALLAVLVLIGAGGLLAGSRELLAARGITIDPLHRGAWGFGSHVEATFSPTGIRLSTVRQWRLEVIAVSRHSR